MVTDKTPKTAPDNNDRVHGESTADSYRVADNADRPMYQFAIFAAIAIITELHCELVRILLSAVVNLFYYCISR